jgi:hypothetical protein
VQRDNTWKSLGDTAHFEQGSAALLSSHVRLLAHP